MRPSAWFAARRSRLYATLLHRAPGPQELNAWVFSALDLGVIRLQVESSPEFQ